MNRTYVINLVTRPDRRREMEAELVSSGWPGPVEWLNEKRPAEKGEWLSIGYKGCFMSHFKALIRGRDSGLSSFAVLVRQLNTALRHLEKEAAPLQIVPLPGREWFDILVRKLLPQIHPLPQLGAGFFTDLIDSLADPNAEPAERVAEFALAELPAFDPNTLDREFLQRLLLHPLTRQQACQWIDDGRLKVQTLPPAFWKVLAFHPAWETDAWVAGLRRGDRAWARDLEFDEALADHVLGWLGDVRRFAVTDLGFTWLMQLVDRSEPRYHDFAVELMIKALRPADFAPVEASTAGTAIVSTL